VLHIDLTTQAVMVEGDGRFEHLLTVRTLQTEGSASRVARYIDEHRQQDITETARARQGTNVMREYDIDEPGFYLLTSGRRELQQNRTFHISVQFVDNETLQISVLPSSFPCTWIVNDDLHNFQNNETYTFHVRITSQGVPQAEGEILRIESDLEGVTFERSTAWSRILEDDDPDSV
jgi:hypothetical protein